MLWFPLTFQQEEPAEFLQKASHEVLFLFLFFCADLSGVPLDACPVSLGAGERQLRVVHRQKVMGCPGGSGTQQMGKSKWPNPSPAVLAVPYLTTEDLQSLQLPSGTPWLVRCPR